MFSWKKSALVLRVPTKSSLCDARWKQRPPVVTAVKLATGPLRTWIPTLHSQELLSDKGALQQLRKEREQTVSTTV